MNSLRKLVDRWLEEFECPETGEPDYHVTEVTDCADELSSAIPAWERLANVAQSILDTDMLVDCDSEHCNFAECAVIRELREALEGVKAK